MQSKIQHMKAQNYVSLAKGAKKEKCEKNLQKSIWLSAHKLQEKQQTRTVRLTTLPSLTKGKAITSRPSE